ncbi:MAG: SIMPL domain-containing protein [Pseudomonadota bacterium]|nr:SIMPL domain-containing protein [Pseudomonadota bacterium]
MIRSFAISAALVIGLTIATPGSVCAASIEIEAEGPVVELRVTETVEAEPEFVTISAGVETEAPTAVEALRKNAAEMSSVVARLKSMGIDGKDIQTSTLSLNQRYDTNRETGERTLRGYAASNRVTIRLRKIEESGKALDALVSAGANDLFGPSFGLEDNTEPKAAARKKAIEKAIAQVTQYADLLGYDGYEVLEVNETIRSSGGRSRAGTVRAFARAVSAETPVESGTISVSTTVAMKFQLTKSDDDS